MPAPGELQLVPTRRGITARAADCKKFNKSGSYGPREFIFARVNRIRRVDGRGGEGRGARLSVRAEN